MLNKKKLIIMVSIIFIFFTVLALVVINSTGDDDKFSTVKSFVPDKFKRYLKRNISYFKAKNLEKELINLESLYIELNKKRVASWRFVSENYMNNMELSLIEKSSENITASNNIMYNLKKYTIPFFDMNYYEWEQKPIGYIEQTQEKVIFITGNGSVFYFNKNDLNLSNTTLKKIETNLNEIILDEEFFNIGRVSVKDLLIKDDYVYMSYTREEKEDCYNTAIIRAELNFNFLNFKDFFVYEDCIPQTYQEWNAHQVGGTMFSEEDSNNIFFSIGEFRERKWAQDKNSIFGKNISINIQNRDYKIISMGHRNVQGIFYDDENKVLIMSEHGPRGGDELNINYDIENEIENYGWPISSYGEHYNKNYPRPEAPLHKSHSKYGFIEPIKYWPLSIGVGRVKKVPENFSQKLIGNSFFVASMGWLPRQGHETLYHLVFNEVFNKITEENKILINERIRDIDFDEENKLVYLVLENSPSIAILKIKE